MQIPRTLDDVLETAVGGGATSVTFELEPDGLEVAYFHGSAGIGVLVTDRDVEQSILKDLAHRAKLGTRTSRNLRLTIHSNVYDVCVTARDHFGETAYDLQFETAAQAPQSEPRRRR